MERIDVQTMYADYVNYRRICVLKTSDGILKTFISHVEKSPTGPYLTKEVIDVWQTRRPTENANSYNIRIGHVNAFLRYINSFYQTDFQLGVLLPSEKTKDPIIPTKDQINKFFKVVDKNTEPPVPNRVKMTAMRQHLKAIQAPVVFRLLISTGIRPIEARLLQVADVDYENGIIHIRRGKGYGERDVTLHPSMLELLKKYENYIRSIFPAREPFFCRENGLFRSKHWPGEWFIEYWEKSNGPTNGVVEYCFRHLFVIDVINSWSDRDYLDLKFQCLAKALGHSSPETTIKYYYHLVPQNSEIFNEKMKSYFDRVIPKIENL